MFLRGLNKNKMEVKHLDIIAKAVERVTEFYETTGFSIPSLNWLDIVDILIVTVLIYAIVSFIRETRAWTLLKGIGLIAVVGILAMIFQLNTISWIIKNTLSVGIIAVIIVFQPEMRTALERLGRKVSTESSDYEGKVTKETATEIAKACIEMSKVKTGALIVIENKVGLREYSKTGIDIDANVKSALLINIFEHNTPLHDGAVIIKNNRILSATCYLPLTESLEVSKELGTRHRAAIGLSEKADALVLVVSEETGNISIVQKGKIEFRYESEKVKLGRGNIEEQIVNRIIPNVSQVKENKKNLRKEKKSK